MRSHAASAVFEAPSSLILLRIYVDRSKKQKEESSVPPLVPAQATTFALCRRYRRLGHLSIRRESFLHLKVG
jgi:hypothetical protein